MGDGVRDCHVVRVAHRVACQNPSFQPFSPARRLLLGPSSFEPFSTMDSSLFLVTEKINSKRRTNCDYASSFHTYDIFIDVSRLMG